MLYSVKINYCKYIFKTCPRLMVVCKELKIIGLQSNKIKGLSKRNQQRNYNLLEIENKMGINLKGVLFILIFSFS